MLLFSSIYYGGDGGNGAADEVRFDDNVEEECSVNMPSTTIAYSEYIQSVSFWATKLLNGFVYK